MNCTSSTMHRTSLLWWCSMVLPTLTSTTSRMTSLACLTATAPTWYPILTMHGASRSARLVHSPARWVRSIPSGIAATSMTKKRGLYYLRSRYYNRCCFERLCIHYGNVCRLTYSAINEQIRKNAQKPRFRCSLWVAKNAINCDLRPNSFLFFDAPCAVFTICSFIAIQEGYLCGKNVDYGSLILWCQ